MRLFTSLIAVAVIFAASAASAAVSWSVNALSTGDLNNAQAGDVITIDITLSSDGTPVFGVGGSVYGADVGSVTLSGGTTSSAALVQFATGPGTGFGGLDSTQAVALDPAGGDAGIQFFNGVSISGTPATGAADISPLTSAAGDPQFQVLVSVNAGLAPGTYTLDVGAGHATDGAVGNGGSALGTTDGSVSFTVVPEPGTALLMGLGLAGLAGAGRRK